MTSDLIGRLGYLGIILILVLGGLGLPVPEEAPIILAAVLSHKKAMFWPFALASCFIGVLVGDFVVYFLGYFYGEKVLSFRLTRAFLTKAREAQIKGYFHRHGVKILIVGRFVVGFRTAAYLTAGILRLPPLKLFLTDLFAASLTTLLLFALGYYFADWVEAGVEGFKRYSVAIVVVSLVAWLLYRLYHYEKARRRAGGPIGPPVPITDEVPLPRDDLHPPTHAPQVLDETPKLTPIPPPEPEPTVNVDLIPLDAPALQQDPPGAHAEPHPLNSQGT
ncbi:MAG: DedA family protein [Isosphaeraceae bacterium]